MKQTPLTLLIIGSMLILLIESTIFGGLLTAVWGCGCVPTWLIVLSLGSIVVTIVVVGAATLQYERTNESKGRPVR